MSEMTTQSKIIQGNFLQPCVSYWYDLLLDERGIPLDFRYPYKLGQFSLYY